MRHRGAKLLRVEAWSRGVMDARAPRRERRWRPLADGSCPIDAAYVRPVTAPELPAADADAA